MTKSAGRWIANLLAWFDSLGSDTSLLLPLFFPTDTAMHHPFPLIWLDGIGRWR